MDIAFVSYQLFRRATFVCDHVVHGAFMTVRRISTYSADVRERLDETRPKYSDAVKSIAAFCDKNAMTKACFQTLVSHLDNACVEARVHAREEFDQETEVANRIIRSLRGNRRP